MDTVMEARGLRKAFGRGGSVVPVLDDISLSVGKGEFLSVVGPSGCGKTTLLLALSGLLPVDAGMVTFLGKTVTGPVPGMSIVFQDYSRSLFAWKTNLDNVILGMIRDRETGLLEKRKRAAELLDAVGLSGFADLYPWQLSGGMQQRVAIARSLATRSSLLLLDEPLAALDAQTRSDMQDLLLALSRRFDQTCVLVTHDVDEAVYLGNRVVVLTGRPARIDHDLAVDLPDARDQLATREDPKFLAARHNVLAAIRRIRGQVAGEPRHGP